MTNPRKHNCYRDVVTKTRKIRLDTHGCSPLATGLKIGREAPGLLVTCHLLPVTFSQEPEMNWIETPIMRRVEHFLDLVTLRHELISSNLANVDTPGYRTQDVDFGIEMQKAEQRWDADPVTPYVQNVKGLIERPDGNNVSLERETMALAQVQLQYRAGVELLRNEIHTLLSAINEGT